MDENNARINSQASIYSDSTGEDVYKNHETNSYDRRICLIGSLINDKNLHSIANCFNVPVVTSDDGLEYLNDNTCCTYYIIDTFEGQIFNNLSKSRQTILGPIALQQLAKENEKNLPDNTRPLFNVAMRGVVVCFAGFRNKDDLTELVRLIHHMGGSIRKGMTAKVTHVIANNSGGDKYQYAFTFKIPVMNLKWVIDSWENRYDLEFNATQDSFLSQYKLKPFHGYRICFLGFSNEEETHMTEILISNGGTVASIDDAHCTHIVMENVEMYTLDPANAPLSPKHQNSLMSILNTEPPPPPPPPPPAPPTIPSCNLPTVSESVSNTNQNNSPSINQNVLMDSTLMTRNDDLVDEMDSICFEEQSSLSLFCTKRKRFASPAPSDSFKCKRGKCSSEKHPRRMSKIFKTPINYFANRRRTIDTSSFRLDSLNSSINSTTSSSTIFNIDTIDNLNASIDINDSPRPSLASLKKTKKNLFTRTFGSSRFASRCNSKNSLLNTSKMSLDFDGKDQNQLNSSCFPDISLNPINAPSSICNNGMSSTDNVQSSRRTTSAALAVVDESSVAERPDVVPKTMIVKAEWFWTSVQKEYSVDEKEYLFDDHIVDPNGITSPSVRRESHTVTPSSASRRKRKRLHETLQSLVQHAQSPALHKRRSSVSDAGLLSVSGSFLDCTASPNDKVLIDHKDVKDEAQIVSARHQVFLELLQTESNYVEILGIIVTLFKKHLETMLDEDPLLNFTEINLIFGKLPPIYETHVKMLDELRWTNLHWKEDRSIGDIIIKYSTELQRAYPPFINYFEEMKEVLTRCDQTKPRFHAFLKAMQTRAECGRQSLQELMIRPVQRLGSISLLLNDLLKRTPKTNLDHAALDQALAALREVMLHINEDKRKTEAQVTLFNIFNDIDNCPPDLVSSHRSYITKIEVIQIGSSEGLSTKGNNLVLFVFTDQLEVCKKKSKSFNSMKSPTPSSSSNFQMQGGKTVVKPYKHVKMMALNTVKRVIDIKDTEDCQRVFSLVCRGNDDLKEKLYSFAIVDEEVDKIDFLRTLIRTMANNVCCADADKFLACLEPQQLDIDTSDIGSNTLSKAFKYAKTRLKVGRTFSFNKSSPSKLKRAVSSMMSPFGSSTNLTPASQLANMRLASYSNINELGNNAENSRDAQLPPLSVQPTRKLKSASLNANNCSKR